MASASSFSKFSVPLLLLVLFLGSTSAQLSTNFYSKSCPNLFSTVKSTVNSAIRKEARTGASLLRLFFHDCFVNGCDGSLLLDDTSFFTGEKNAIPNRNSARGFDVVDNVKSAVEKVCPGVVSCADILAIAARDSVSILGGPNWNVKLGRRDARTASQSAANSGIPPPTSDLIQLISTFSALGLSTRDLVALSGGHTIGQARCTSFRNRVYNDSNIDSSFGRTRQGNCPRTGGIGDNNLAPLDLNCPRMIFIVDSGGHKIGQARCTSFSDPIYNDSNTDRSFSGTEQANCSSYGTGDNNLAPLDLQTPTSFDNNYFKNLINMKGLLHSDQELLKGTSTYSIVEGYSNDASSFSSDFVAAMIKMGDIIPLTGSSGEIRENCRRVN